MSKPLKRTLIVVTCIVLAILLTLALQVDDWSRDLNTNRAATSADAADTSLRTLQLQNSPGEVQQQILNFAENASAWSVVKTTDDQQQIVMHLERTTPLLRFVDDVTVYLEPTDTGTSVDVTSQSRVGKGDLGQNPRNIRELLQVLR